MTKKQRKALKVIDKNTLPKGPKEFSTKKSESDDESSIESWKRQDTASSKTPKISNRGRNRNVTMRGFSHRRPSTSANQKKRRSLGNSILNPFAPDSKRQQRMVKKSSNLTKRDFDRLKPLVRRLDNQQGQIRRFESLLLNNKKNSINTINNALGSIRKGDQISTKGQELDTGTKETNVQHNDSDDDMNCDSSDDCLNFSASSSLSLSPSSSLSTLSTMKSSPKNNLDTSTLSEEKNATPSQVEHRVNGSNHKKSDSQTFTSALEAQKIDEHTISNCRISIMDATNVQASNLATSKNMTNTKKKKDVELFSYSSNDGRSTWRNSEENMTATSLFNHNRKTRRVLNEEHSKEQEELGVSVHTPPTLVLTKLPSASSNNYHEKEKVDEDDDEKESIEAWSVDGHNSSPFLFEINGKKYAHPALPPGWKMRISESGKQPVYMHPDHGSTWHCPIKLTPNAVYVKTTNGKLEKQSRVSEHITSKPELFANDKYRRNTRQTPPSTRNPRDWRKEMKHSVSIELPSKSRDKNAQIVTTSYPLSPQSSTNQLLKETSDLSAQLLKNSSSNLKNVKKVHRSTQRLAKGRPTDLHADFNGKQRLLYFEESETPSTMSGVIRQYDEAKERDYDLPASSELCFSHSNTHDHPNKTLCNERLLDTNEIIGMNENKQLSPILEAMNQNDEDDRANKMKTGRNKYKTSMKRNNESTTSSFGTPLKNCDLKSTDPFALSADNKREKTQRRTDKSSSFDHFMKSSRSDERSMLSITKEKQTNLAERIEAWFTPKTRIGEVNMTVEDDLQNYEDVAIHRFDVERSKSSRLLLHSTDKNIQNNMTRATIIPSIYSTVNRNHDGSDKNLVTLCYKKWASPAQLHTACSGKRIDPNYHNSCKDKRISVFGAVDDMERNDTAFFVRTPIKEGRDVKLSESVTQSNDIPQEIHCKSQPCRSAEQADSSSIENSQGQILQSSKEKNSSEKKVVATKLAHRESIDVKQFMGNHNANRIPEEKSQIQNVIRSYPTLLNIPENTIFPSLSRESNREVFGSVDNYELYTEGNRDLPPRSKVENTAAVHSHTEKADTCVYDNVSGETSNKGLNVCRVGDNTSEASKDILQSSDVRDKIIAGNIVTGKGSVLAAASVDEKQISCNHSEVDSTHSVSSSTTKKTELPIEFCSLPDDISDGYQSSLDSTKTHSTDHNDGTPRSIASEASISITSSAEDYSFSSKGDSIRFANDATSAAEFSDESDAFDDSASLCTSRFGDKDDTTSRLSSFESPSLASRNQRTMSWRVLNPPHPICSLQGLDELILDRKRKELKGKRFKIGSQTKRKIFSSKKRGGTNGRGRR